MKENELTILLLEQMPEMNGVLLSILHELNFSNIHLYKRVEDAWRHFKKIPPDLIICDWYADKYDTLVLLKQVRQASQGADTPFIIVSGIIEHNLVKQAIAMGVSEYIVKPFSVNMFEQKIKLALQHKTSANNGNYFKPKIRETFNTKIGLCFKNRSLMDLVLPQLKSYTSAHFQTIDSALVAAETDKTLDLLVIEHDLLLAQTSLQSTLLKLCHSGQLDVILISEQPIPIESNELRKRGFKHFIDTRHSLVDLATRADLIINLKKALLHTKDTVMQAASEVHEAKEFENNVLESIQSEAAQISSLSEQIKATAKKPSLTHQLSDEIHQRAEKIESYKSVLTSSLKDLKTLQHSEKELLSVSQLIEKANELFSNQLKQRKISFVSHLSGEEQANVNPTLFASLFMFLMRSIILDSRYESNIEFSAEINNESTFVEVKICAEMTGFPHLQDIMKHTWFEQNGELNFVLKDTIEQLCKSQLHHYEIKFDQTKSLLNVIFSISGRSQ